MKKKALIITLLILSLAGCGKREQPTTEEILLKGGSKTTDYEDINEKAAEKAAEQKIIKPASAGDAVSNHFDYSDIPEYTSDMYIVVNNDIPFFTEGDLTTECYFSYSPLDSLGRCGSSTLVVCKDTLPEEEREDIGKDIKPSGWHQNKYPGIVDSDPPYIFNRAHLGMWAMEGNQSNVPENLITGTRKFNTEAMLPNEMEALEFIKSSDMHLLYRVTPYFEGDDLLARGVLMEAMSVEDKGESFHFCRWAYNVQPGVEIDYSTGENWIEEN
jgi:hypothetical protein